MERCVRAIYYEYNYYLLPDGEGLPDVLKKGKCKLTRLKEELCMAPDFVYESMAEEEVDFISPEHAFEVFVNLYTREEYDAILLTQVRKVCPGCEAYSSNGPNDTDLDGHHREISLKGLCYEREEADEEPSFLYKVHWFWQTVSQMTTELGKCIDKGDQKKLNKLLNDKLTAISYEFKWFGTVQDGKYCLCMSTGGELPFAYNNITAFFAAVASQEDSEMSEKGWVIYPCYKKGVYSYPGKKSFDSDIPALYLEKADFPFLVSVYIYTPEPEKLNDKARIALFSEVRCRLCEKIGEEVELSVVEGYELGDKKDRAESLNVIAEKLSAAYKLRHKQEEESDENEEEVDDGAIPFPDRAFFMTDGVLEENDYLPHRYLMTSGMTSAFDIALCSKKTLFENMWWGEFFTFAYLVIPGDVALSFVEPFYWYMHNTDCVPDPIGDPKNGDTVGLSIGAGAGEDYLINDFIVFDEKKFLHTIRVLAPLFEGKDIKLVTMNDSGVKEYLCGFDMTVLSQTDL